MPNTEGLINFTARKTVNINEKNHLKIADVDTVSLAKKHGTPLIIYDSQTIREKIQALKEGLATYQGKTEVSYASKAFSSVAFYQIIKEEGIAIGVVSGGELFLAKQAEFPAERINFHGNNKSVQELEDALDYDVGTVIVDNFYEMGLLNQLATQRQKVVDVLLRITPGVSVDTHRYVMTGQADSKFSFDLQNGQAEEALQQALQTTYLNVRGLHMHLGSQLFDTASYVVAIDQLLKHAKDWGIRFEFDLKVLNIGGGFGIQHTLKAADGSPKKQLTAISQELMKLLEQ